jgi:hypothetical protein
VTTISHVVPTFVVLGILNVAVIDDESDHVTVVAGILVSPERCSRAVMPETKPDPVISVDTVVPTFPSAGSISLIAGLKEDVVVVATAVVCLVVTDVVIAVVIVVGADVGIEDTVTCVIFIVYNFSIIARVDVSVAELVRYPHVPSAFLKISARV